MKATEVNQNAAVVGQAETLVAAPIDTVWALLTDFAHWPTWNRGVARMDLKGALEVGTEFVWGASGSRIRSRLEAVDAPHRIVWSGRTLGIQAIHVWEFETVHGATRVRTRESFEGLLVRLFPGLMARVLDKALEQGLADLKREAEVASAISVA